jgi:hypothetical protein
VIKEGPVMDALRKEIREALLGDLMPTEDGRIAVSFTRLAKYVNGLGDGYDKVRIFGVMCRRRWYLSKKNARQMHELAVKGMQDMGRMMWLSSDPEKEAVYCSYLLNTPAILTYSRGEDGVIEMACYSARGLSGWIACYRTLNKFQRKVPNDLQRMSEEDEQKKQGAVRAQATEERLQTRQAKKEKKLEKKRLRKEKRRARLAKFAGVMPKLPGLPVEINAGSDILATEQNVTRENNKVATEQNVTKENDKAAAEQNVTKENDKAAAEQTRLEAEQARLEAEAEQAKVRARVAKARLEAAQARLEAEEAEEKLLETQAKLAAKHEAMQDKAGVDGNKGNSNRKNGNGKKKR